MANGNDRMRFILQLKFKKKPEDINLDNVLK